MESVERVMRVIFNILQRAASSNNNLEASLKVASLVGSTNHKVLEANKDNHKAVLEANNSKTKALAGFNKTDQSLPDHAGLELNVKR